jgi:transcriptional regulator with XRE-family HTH domain
MPTFAITQWGRTIMDGVDIVRHTQHLLINRPKPVTFAKIEAGAGISPRWLGDFANGRITEPSAQRIQKLYEYLTGEPLIK